MEKPVSQGLLGDLPGCLRFFWAGVAKRLQTGGIVPSQRFLISKMIAPVAPTYRGRIIELGCGTGALTLRLAARCPSAQILACDLNPVLAEHSRRRITMAGLHRRVSVVSDSAEHVLETATQGGWSKPDYIISGIPLGNIRAKHVVALVTAVHQALAEDGMYIQFQHSLIDQKRIRACFARLHTVPVFLNFPPAVVYYASV
jgi:phospholipid N-methyltransferase